MPPTPGPRMQELRAHHSYGWVLLITALLVVLSIGLPESDAARLVLVVLTGANLVAAAWVSEARPVVARIALGVAVVGVLAAAASILSSGATNSGLVSAVMAVLVLATPAVMARGLLRSLRQTGVTSQVIFGALSFYLLIGFFCGLLYGVLAHYGHAPLFDAPRGDGTTADRLYFSFTTQTTVGYGDFAPHTGPARAVAVSQALVGQLYLVTVLALLVGNLGRRPAARDQA